MMNLKECRTLCRQMNIEESIFDPVDLTPTSEQMEMWSKWDPEWCDNPEVFSWKDFKFTPPDDFGNEFMDVFEIVPKAPKKKYKKMKHGYTCH